MAYTLEEDITEPYNPVSALTNGFTPLEGYRLATSAVRTSFFGVPSMTYSANYYGPEDQAEATSQAVYDSLPNGDEFPLPASLEPFLTG